ncbi:MAG: hydroxymethylpyrimidine/phosphomethylpyrimidine kinase [Proteobacteria bacterium]|nr:hydroxymethylpyrimidine/phosphomethylpyrimidine kinase [Pseudomonadota bacterium]
MQQRSHPPVVLVIAGNDPSGGAGIAADIQAITRLGCHPAPVLAALTVQDTINAYAVEPVSPSFVHDQAARVLDDLPVRAIKLGLLGTADIGEVVAQLLGRFPDIPVVTDPVLVAAGGAQLAEDRLVDTFRERIIPRTTVLTPNAQELRRLAPDATTTRARAAALLSRGAEWVMAKGGDEKTPAVDNFLFNRNGETHDWTWERIDGEHHGSGCTLAAAIAAYLARGEDVPHAVELAQQFTFTALKNGWQLGRGQRIPDRH